MLLLVLTSSLLLLALGESESEQELPLEMQIGDAEMPMQPDDVQIIDDADPTPEPQLDDDETAPPTEPVPGALTLEDLQPTAEDLANAEVAFERLKKIMYDELQTAELPAVLREVAALRSGSDGRRKRPRSAIPLLQALADAANHTVVDRTIWMEAERHLGDMYLRGEGVAMDIKEAVAHYTRAATEGEPDAQHALGVLYSTGFGVEKHGALAATYLYFAAEGGSVGAQLAGAATPHSPHCMHHTHTRPQTFSDTRYLPPFFAHTYSWLPPPPRRPGAKGLLQSPPLLPPRRRARRRRGPKSRRLEWHDREGAPHRRQPDGHDEARRGR